MGHLKFDNKAMLAHVRNRLHTELQTRVIPFCKDRVRTDTGRLRESIHAEFPIYTKGLDQIKTQVVFGGTQELPTRRDDGKGSRQVDYVEDLESRTNNISEDILFELFTLY
jgi:hypothetical protein